MHMNDAFKALADPTRQILRLFRREKTAGELARHFDVSKPSMSHHFTVLRQADLIASRRDGQQICLYFLNTTVVEDLLAVVWGLLTDRNGPAKDGQP